MSWGTPFSCFRFAVPELCNFEGRAIYLDADQLVLGDIGELWDMAPASTFGLRSIDWRRTDVSVFDCGWAGWQQPWWPEIKDMKQKKARVFEYIQLLKFHHALDASLPKEWNDCDGQLYSTAPGSVKLIHFTNVLCGQPYKPYPNVKYPEKWPHCTPCPEAGELWHQYHKEAIA
jgi:hypothetical protein